MLTQNPASSTNERTKLIADRVARMRQLEASFNQNLRYDIEDGSLLLKQSRAKTYLDIQAGTLRAIKDGKRIYIPGTEIARRSRLPEQAA